MSGIVCRVIVSGRTCRSRTKYLTPAERIYGRMNLCHRRCCCCRCFCCCLHHFVLDAAKKRPHWSLLCSICNSNWRVVRLVLLHLLLLLLLLVACLSPFLLLLLLLPSLSSLCLCGLCELSSMAASSRCLPSPTVASPSLHPLSAVHLSGYLSCPTV